MWNTEHGSWLGYPLTGLQHIFTCTYTKCIDIILHTYIYAVHERMYVRSTYCDCIDYTYVQTCVSC